MKWDTKSIIVTVLICFMLFFILSNWFSASGFHEGFQSIQFNYSAKPLTEETISVYSPTRKVRKVYDNIYFDRLNGNLIELIGKTSGTAVAGTTLSGTVDSTGTSITSINILPRGYNNTNMTSYTTVFDNNGNPTPVTTKESQNTQYNTSVSSPWTYATVNGFYQVTYIPYNTNTYIHVMDISKQTNKPALLCSVCFDNTVQLLSYYDWTTTSQNTIPVTSKGTGNVIYSSVTSTVMPIYDSSKTVLQAGQYVFYDASNGNVIVQSNSGPSSSSSINVYARDSSGVAVSFSNTNGAMTTGGTTTSSTYKMPSNVVSPMLIPDTLGNTFIVYWPLNTTTVFTMFSSTVNSSVYPVVNNMILNNYSTLVVPTSISATLTFSSGGSTTLNAAATAAALGTTTAATTTTTTAATTTTPTIVPMIPDPSLNNGMLVPNGNTVPFTASADDSLSNYYKWYWYWNTYNTANQNIAGYSGGYSNDYLLKTQIVPPVCPACQSCTGASCQYCGSGGGGNASSSSSNNNSNTTTTAQQSTNYSGSQQQQQQPSTSNQQPNNGGAYNGNITNTATGGSSQPPMPEMWRNGQYYTANQAVPPSNQRSQMDNVLPVIADFSKFGR